MTGEEEVAPSASAAREVVPHVKGGDAVEGEDDRARALEVREVARVGRVVGAKAQLRAAVDG